VLGDCCAHVCPVMLLETPTFQQKSPPVSVEAARLLIVMRKGG
jgi:hypothetical protein